jgi:replicative DNA helicase
MSIESSIIGMAIADLQARIRFIDLGIKDTAFTDNKSSRAWNYIYSIHNRSSEVNLVTVSELMPDHTGWLIDCLQNAPVTANPDWYAQELLRRSWLRESATKLSQLANQMSVEITGESFDELRIQLEETARSLLSKKVDQKVESRSVKDVLSNYIDDLEARCVQRINGQTRGLSTGIKLLDEVLHGWMPSCLYLLAARTSLGKTTLAINFANTAIENGKKVLFFTNEMPDVQICEKQLSLRSGVFNVRLFNGNLEDSDLDKIHKEIGNFSSKNLFINHKSGRKLHTLIAEIKAMYALHKIDFVILDYIQQVSIDDKPRGMSRVAELGEVADAIKRLSLELGIPMLCLAQVNRSAEKSDEPPTLASIRDSGALEQDADGVIFIHRDRNVGEGKCVLSVAKNRFGPTKEIFVNVDLKVNRFF